MVNLSTVENALQSDKVPVYLGANRLYLKKGLQSSNRNINIPTETVAEQGNRLNRGTTVNVAEVTFSMEDLSVDMDMEQVLGEQFSSLNGNIVNNAPSGADGLVSTAAEVSGGISIFIQGPTDKINSLVISYHSGASGALRVGEGAPITSVTASNIVNVSSAKAINFSVGDSVILQSNNGAINTEASVITNISGGQLTIAGSYTASSYSSNGFIFIEDSDPIPSAEFYDGKPNISVKGIEVFCFNSSAATIAASTTSAVVGYQELSYAGSTELDSDNWRDSEIDVLMLYNDHSNDLLFTRYIQDVGVTSTTINCGGEGYATQTYDFISNKGLDFVGYVLRKSMVINDTDITGTNVDLDAANSFVFDGAEEPVAISTNTSLNQKNYDTYFLKLSTIDETGNRIRWTEVNADPSNKEYTYNSTTKTITFGSGSIPAPVAGQRLELTYLCAAGNVASGSEFKFDGEAFDHTGTPTAVTGQYQPLTINSADEEDRIKGIDTSSITINFERSFNPSQGFIAPELLTSSVGSVDGSMTTKEGYTKIMTVITQSGSNGGYTELTSLTQQDINKAGTYSNTNTVPLYITLYDPADNITVIKKIKIPSIQINTVENSNSVGDNSTINISFIGKDGNVNYSR